MKQKILWLTAACLFALCDTSFAQSGRCQKAKDVIAEKTWAAIRYKYSPQYVQDNKAEFEKVVSSGTTIFFNDCQSSNLSNEQILLLGALDFAAMPIKLVADEFLKRVGLPPVGYKALHIDVYDIEKKGIWGGPNSVFRNPIG